MSEAAFLFALSLTAMLVPGVRRAGRTLDLFAHPQTDRWHVRPVPHLGGVAMFLPVVLALCLTNTIGTLKPLVVLAVLMFLVGLADDLRPIRPTGKLILQVGVAAVFLYIARPVAITGQPIVDLLLGFLWIVGITNE